MEIYAVVLRDARTKADLYRFIYTDKKDTHECRA